MLQVSPSSLLGFFRDHLPVSDFSDSAPKGWGGSLEGVVQSTEIYQWPLIVLAGEGKQEEPLMESEAGLDTLEGEICFVS